jgi:hypothetical protein
VDGHHLAFLDVAGKAGSTVEAVEYHLYGMQIAGDWGDEHNDVIDVQRGLKWDRTNANQVQQ